MYFLLVCFLKRILGRYVLWALESRHAGNAHLLLFYIDVGHQNQALAAVRSPSKDVSATKTAKLQASMAFNPTLDGLQLLGLQLLRGNSKPAFLDVLQSLGLQLR